MNQKQSVGIFKRTGSSQAQQITCDFAPVLNCNKFRYRKLPRRVVYSHSCCMTTSWGIMCRMDQIPGLYVPRFGREGSGNPRAASVGGSGVVFCMPGQWVVDGRPLVLESVNEPDCMSRPATAAATIESCNSRCNSNRLGDDLQQGRCWSDVGPASKTLDQHQTNNVSAFRVTGPSLSCCCCYSCCWI